MLSIFSRLNSVSIQQSILQAAARSLFQNFRQVIVVRPREEEHRMRLTWSRDVEKLVEVLASILCPRGKWSEKDFNELVDECMEHSLLYISAHDNTHEILYSMYALVQIYLQISSEIIRQYRPGQLAVHILSSAFVGDPDQEMLFVRQLVPHIRLVNTSDVADVCECYGYGVLLRACSYYLTSTTHWEHCLAFWMSMLPEDNSLIYMAMSGLVWAYAMGERYDVAIEFYNYIIENSGKMRDHDHPLITTAAHNLAICYHGDG